MCALQKVDTEVLQDCRGQLAPSSGDKGDSVAGVIEEMHVKCQVSGNLCFILLCNSNLQFLYLACKW